MEAASLSLYIQVSFVTFSHLIVCPFRVRVLMRRPRSRPCLKTHNTACCPHQQVAEGWWLAGVSANASPAGKANISIFNTAARPAPTSLTVCMTNRPLALVHGGDQYLMAHRSRCWNACFTFLHQSLLSHTTRELLFDDRITGVRGGEGTRGARKMWWTGGGVEGLGADGNKGILKPVMFYDRDWT